MSLTPEVWTRAEALLAADGVDFLAMVEIAGIDKTRAFRHGDMRRCQLGAQHLGGFDFTGAKFDGAVLSRTVFTDAILDNADLSKAVGIREAILDGARWNEHTIWPEDFSPCPPWADAAGCDRYGKWARFDVEGADGTVIRQKLRWIPAGAFVMGSPDGEEGRFANEGPQQPIVFRDGFWMFDTPCTQALWAAVIHADDTGAERDARAGDGESPRRQAPGLGTSLSQRVRRFLRRFNPLARNRGFPSQARVDISMDDLDGPLEPELGTRARRDDAKPSFFEGPDRPVEQVSFHDVARFMRVLNKLKPGLNLSLPSEAQWEYACRVDTTGATWAGPGVLDGKANAAVLDRIAWWDGNSGRATHPVGQKEANPWGLYDMLGNVWEWCADAWHDSHEGARPDGAPRAGGSAAHRVLRGGSWFHDARYVRSASRHGIAPSVRDDGIGFRCARVQ